MISRSSTHTMPSAYVTELNAQEDSSSLSGERVHVPFLATSAARGADLRT